MAGIADIAIAGGGPAGAVAALLLRRSGATVTLIDSAKRPSVIEGLSPRVMQLLGSLGLEASGVGPPVVRETSWGRLSPAPNREHAVDRFAFDAGLRRQAGAVGIGLVEGVAIRTVEPGRIVLDTGDVIRAGLVIEARGRRAPVAPGARRGTATLSLAGWTGQATTHRKMIAAEPEGWRWQASLPGRGIWKQLTLDAGVVSGSDQAVEIWRGAGGRKPPRVRGAEIRLNAPDLDPQIPRLGDAAVAMDPLSGHGIFWALSSALAAPPLVRALLDGEVALARAFYGHRVVETFWRQARIGRDFHRAANLTGPFWARRAAWPDDEPAHQAGATPPRLERRVVVRDGRLAEADVLVSHRDPGGAAFVHGVEIGPILRRLGPDALPDRRAFATRVVPDLPPDQAGAIHAWLMDRGVRGRPPGPTAKKKMEETA